MIAPKLRFSEFKDEWNESNVGSLISNSSEKFNPLKETVNLPCVELEHLSQGTGEIIGYCSSVKQKSIKNKFNEKNVLFGKLRPYLKKYAKPNFKGVCSSEIWVLSSQRLNTNFLFQYIQTRAFLDLTLIQSGSKMPRAEWEMVADGTIFYPQEKEQTKIAEFLSAVDEKISQLSRQLELLNQYKKGVMQKIFSQEIRFKNENGEDFGEWVDTLFGSFITERNQNCSDENIPLYSLTIQDGITPKTERYTRDFLVKDDSNAYKIVFPKDFAMNPMNLRFGAMALHNKEMRVKLSKYYNIFYLDESKVNPAFFNYYATSEKAIALYNAMSTGSLIEKRRNHFSDFINYEMPFPSIEEQTKIAEFLTAIDEQIDHTTAQLTHTKQWKKGLLQQMFV